MATKSTETRRTSTAGGDHGGDDEGPLPNGLSYEVRDARVSPILFTGVVLVILTIFTFVLIWVMVYAFGPGQTTNTLDDPALVETPITPPEPRLQQKPYFSGNEVLAEQNERLESYGWIDQMAGKVHIPIDRAVELTLERGLPTARPTAPPTATPMGTPQPTPTASP